MTCPTCQQPINLLNSQKNGSDVCLSCALEQASKIHYTLKRRSEPIIDEVICQKHYQEQIQEGRGMAPLTDREIGAGYVVRAVAYSGPQSCATCAADAMHAERKAS